MSDISLMKGFMLCVELDHEAFKLAYGNWEVFVVSVIVNTTCDDT